MEYIILTKKEEETARKVVNAAYIVHKKLGPGLLESVYETCFCYELEKNGTKVKKQVPVPRAFESLRHL